MVGVRGGRGLEDDEGQGVGGQGVVGQRGGGGLNMSGVKG